MKTNETSVKLLKNSLMFLVIAVIFLAVISAVSASSTGSSSSSSIIYVNGSDGDDAKNGTSWEWAKKTITNAVNTVAVNGTIYVANGNYNEHEIQANKNMTIIGESQKNTVVDAHGVNRVFTNNDPNKNYYITLINLTIQNGDNTPDHDGGAIHIYEGNTFSVINCTFKNNTAKDGGAIINHGTLILSGCTFTGNIATNNGGAIYSDGTLTVTNCTFTGNIATGSNVNYGGAIYNKGSFLNLNNCTLVNNSANEGGAIYNTDEFNQNSWAVSSSIFKGNTATNVGGAIRNKGNALSLDNCIFTGNTAHNSGGALWTLIGTLTVTHCIFTGNTATNGVGGAIRNGDICNITGSTLTDNSATKGGAISTGNNLNANFNRIVGNKASEGSAIYNDWGNANVKYNWWGSNNPDFSSLIKNGQLSSTNAEPWLKLSINANPNEILNTKASNVAVNLYTDSNGDNHSSEYAEYPSEISLKFITTWGSITQKVLNYGTCTVVFTANGGPIPQQNPVIVSVADILNQTATVSTTIKIKPAADLYIYTTSSKTNPKAGETFTLTYKLGNNGPDAAENVTITIKLPEGFEKFEIKGDGKWTYDPSTRTITWTLTNVPVGDPYLYVTGKLTNAGNYIFNSAISSETYNLNTDGVTPITLKSKAQNNTNTNSTISISKANAASKTTIGMQKTGLPLNYFILAILMVIGGLAPRRK